MGLLVAQGALLILGIIIGLIFTIIGLFFGHIIVFDSIALGIVAGVCGYHFLSILPALCIIIAIATFLLLFWLQNTRFGFWLIGGLLSLIYAFVFSAIAYSSTHKDSVWGWVVFGLSFLIMIGLHLRARSKS